MAKIHTGQTGSKAPTRDKSRLVDCRECGQKVVLDTLNGRLRGFHPTTLKLHPCEDP